jgi:peptidoglycan/LPS O-acetylase OafA/YrhL
LAALENAPAAITSLAHRERRCETTMRAARAGAQGSNPSPLTVRMATPRTPDAAPDVGTVEPAVRPPPGNPRFPLFDSLRAIAALAVVAYHVAIFNFVVAGWPGAFAQQLASGVTVFFLISGFLLYRPFVVARLGGKPVRVRDFARRRVLRIVPAYWVALTVLAIYPGLSGVFSERSWVFYGFGQIYLNSTNGRGLATAWTLCTEMSFYVLLPIYAAVLSRPLLSTSPRRVVVSDVTVLAALSAATIPFRAYIGSSHPNLAWSLPGTFDWFALGMALAVLSAARIDLGVVGRRAITVLEARPSIAWLVSVATYSSCAAWFHHTQQYNVYTGSALHLGWGLTAFFLLLPAVVENGRRGWPRRLLAAPFAAWLGVISYGIYLWHLPFAGAHEHWLPVAHSLASVPGGYLLLFSNVAAVAVACAAVSYYLIERPILRLKDVRRQDRRQIIRPLLRARG